MQLFKLVKKRQLKNRNQEDREYALFNAKNRKSCKNVQNKRKIREKGTKMYVTFFQEYYQSDLYLNVLRRSFAWCDSCVYMGIRKYNWKFLSLNKDFLLYTLLCSHLVIKTWMSTWKGVVVTMFFLSLCRLNRLDLVWDSECFNQ